MSGRSSRSKGKRGETAARMALLSRDYEVMQRPRGEPGDDFMAVKDGKCWSVEVKNTSCLMLSHYIQCKTNAGNKPRMLMWHPSRWGFPTGTFLVFSWDGGKCTVKVWHAKEAK